MTPRLLLAVCCLVTRGQISPPTGGIDGEVVDGRTEKPVSGVGVTATRVPNGDVFEARTNANGKFVIDNIPPGIYEFNAQLQGFAVDDARTGYLPRNQIALGAREAVRFKILPHAVFTGRVIDENNEPVERANVEVLLYGRVVASQHTDARGEYRVAGLLPERYRVRVRPELFPQPPQIRTDGSEEPSYVVTYYPGSTTASEAKIVEARLGVETGGIDMRLIRLPKVCVTGRVLGIPSQPVQPEIFVTSDGQFLPVNWRVYDGKFGICGLSPAKYTIAARASGPGTRLYSAPIEFEIAGSNVGPLELPLIEPFDVAVTVNWEDKTPPGTQQTARLFLLARSHGRLSSNGPVERNGDKVVFRQVPAGVFTIAVGGTRNVYVKTVQVGTQSAGTVLDLRAGALGQPVTVTLSPAVGAITGFVRGKDGPLAMQPVALVPEDFSSIIAERSYTRPDGSYRFVGLRPGRYRIAVMDSKSSREVLWTNAWPDPAPETIAVDLKEAETAKRDFRVDR